MASRSRRRSWGRWRRRGPAERPVHTFLELPVYYSWEFATGPGGDFASLAALLRARPLDATTGTVDLDVGEAGEGLPVIPNTSTDRTLRLEGALLSPKAVRKGFTTNAGVAFQQRLATLIVQPSSPDEDPIVGPPLYGDRAAGVATLPAANAAPQWLRDLNLDPRYRVVSALGRQVIQQHQEQILASVWQQTGDIERANTLLRNAHFAQTVSDAVVRKRFAPLPPDALLQLTRSVQGRLADGQGTVRSSLKAHHTADAAASPAFRRVARPRGRLMRPLMPSASRTVLGTFTKLATNAMFVHVQSADRRHGDAGSGGVALSRWWRHSPCRAAGVLVDVPVRHARPHVEGAGIRGAYAGTLAAGQHAAPAAGALWGHRQLPGQPSARRIQCAVAEDGGAAADPDRTAGSRSTSARSGKRHQRN